MFTDIVAYSTMSQRDEAGSLDLLAEHDAIVRPIVADFDGIEIKTIGDAFLVEFASALNAVHSAIQIQHSFHDRNSRVGCDRRIELRIGLHLGDIVHTANDILGDGVNIAARIQALADPNGVCVSQQVFDQVRGKLDATFVEVPRPKLKNIDSMTRVYFVRFPWTGQSRGWGERLSEGIRLKFGKIRIVVTLISGVVLAISLSYLGGTSRSLKPDLSSSGPGGKGATAGQSVSKPPVELGPPSVVVGDPVQRRPTHMPEIPAPPEGPVKREISAEEHAQAEIDDLIKRFCAAHETLKVEEIQKMFPLAPAETYRYQFRQYKTLKCSITSKPEFVRLDARSAGAAQVKFGMKQVIQMGIGGDPQVKDTIVAMTVSRAGFRDPWLIDRIVVDEKPK